MTHENYEKFSFCIHKEKFCWNTVTLTPLLTAHVCFPITAAELSDLGPSVVHRAYVFTTWSFTEKFVPTPDLHKIFSTNFSVFFKLGIGVSNKMCQILSNAF